MNRMVFKSIFVHHTETVNYLTQIIISCLLGSSASVSLCCSLYPGYSWLSSGVGCMIMFLHENYCCSAQVNFTQFLKIVKWCSLYYRYSRISDNVRYIVIFLYKVFKYTTQVNFTQFLEIVEWCSLYSWYSRIGNDGGCMVMFLREVSRCTAQVRFAHFLVLLAFGEFCKEVCSLIEITLKGL